MPKVSAINTRLYKQINCKIIHFSCRSLFLYLLPLVLFFFLYNQQAFSQELRSGIPSPVKLNATGRFVFYNPAVYKTIGNRTIQSQSVMPLLGNGNIHQPHRTYKVSGEIVLYIKALQPTCGYGSGSIVVETTNGTAPYFYELVAPDGYIHKQNLGNFQGLRAGIYLVRVTDANGKITTQSVTLADELQQPVTTLSISKFPSSCTANDGSFSLQTTGGKPPYEYSMDLVNFQSSPMFLNLYNGVYEVYTRDANGCLYSNFVDFASKNKNCITPLSLSYGLTECTQNAGIYLSYDNNQKVFSYSMDGINYQSSPSFKNLSYGLYHFYIKDANGILIHIVGINFIHDCNVQIDFVAMDASCGFNDGSLTANTINGLPPYSFSIDGINYQSSSTFTGLAPGNYTVTVKDANGNTHSQRASVYDRCPVVRGVSTGETCSQNDGTITLGGFKGTAPYQYSIDGVHFQSNNEFTGLTAGDYTVTMKDDNGFTAATTITVDNACLPFTTAQTDATCNSNNGSLTITVTGGTAPYQYSIDGSTFQSGNIFNSLAPGNYTLTVKDAGGKKAGKQITIKNIPVPVINTTITAAGCLNNDGKILINVTDGVSPYLYSIDGINFQASNEFTALAGLRNYTITVQDKSLCKQTATVYVSKNCPEANINSADETCKSKNGSITVTGFNGTGPYQYSLDGLNFQSGGNFINLPAGNYTVTIKDQLQYINSYNIVLKNICPAVTAVGKDGLCGSANASITATGADGAEPYTYAIDGQHFQSSNLFAGLTNGTYTVTVKDARGLMNTTTVTVVNYPSPQIQVTLSATDCLNNNGSVHLEGTGGVKPYSYSLTGFTKQTSADFMGLSKADYTATITDANGCIATGQVTIPLNDNLSVSLAADTTICEGGKLQLPLVSNGTAFSWSPSIQLSSPIIKNPVASPVTTTKYVVEATLGICNKTDSVLINVNPAPVADAGLDQQICYGKSTQLHGSGGSAYSWNPSVYLDNPSVQNPVVQAPLKTTAYTLTVTDAKNCSSLIKSIVTVTVKPPAKLFAGNDTAILKNVHFQLMAFDVNQTGFTDFQWLPVTGLNNSKIQNPLTVLDNDITYYVRAATLEGCVGMDTIKLSVYAKPEIFVPTGFTPNNDGLNDVLKAIPVGIKEFRFFKVFNRWGQEIFRTTDAAIGWDGTYKNILQDPGTFTWYTVGIDYNGKIVSRSGYIILIR